MACGRRWPPMTRCCAGRLRRTAASCSSTPMTVSLVHPLPGKPPSATTAYREDDHSADRQVMPMSFQVVGDLLPGASYFDLKKLGRGGG